MAQSVTQRFTAPTLREIPDADCVIIPATRQLASIGAEGEGADGAGVAGEDRIHHGVNLPARHLPQGPKAHKVVITAASDGATIGAEGEGADQIGIALQEIVGLFTAWL